MLICTNCQKEMSCSRTGMLVVWGTYHARAGDEFSCGDCGARVITTNASSFEADDSHIAVKDADKRLLVMPQ